MTNLILIGGSGFVGTRLTDMIKPEYNLKIFDKQPGPFHPEITVIGDVRDQEIMNRELSGQDAVVLLAAEHRDDVSPPSLYEDVNVQGAKNVLTAMDQNRVEKIIFFSSVAVYGLNKKNPDEQHPPDPFNHYGKSKWRAEELLREWYQHRPGTRSLTIIRPTVIFGERNRGNVYNLLKQIASRRFLIIGNGNNYKSMAYVANVAAFVKYLLKRITPGYQLFNYVDKPDVNMNQLVALVEENLGIRVPSVHLPYPMGMMIGYSSDLLAKLTGKTPAITSVRVRKFCATTQFDATRAHQCGFIPPFSLEEGLSNTLRYEFVHPPRDEVTFVSE
ncbi:MAG: NAD-dependent epimerase/dehydratase family protein [Prolixibacteraceae bacterium]